MKWIICLFKEILHYCLTREISIHNPMIYGKNLKSIINENKAIIEKFSPEQQMQFISNLMKPADAKSLYRQVINQISEDFIKQVSDNYELDKDKENSSTVRMFLSKAFNSKIEKAGYVIFETINNFIYLPNENQSIFRFSIDEE